MKTREISNIDEMWEDFIEMCDDAMDMCNCPLEETFPYYARKRVKINGKEIILKMQVEVV